MIERIIPPGIPVPTFPYSPAVRAGDFIYVSGQVAVDLATNKLSLGDIRHETRIILENIKRILEGSGATKADVVKCNVYLRDAPDFAGMNEVYAEFFGADKPARTTVVVKFANTEICCEIDCIAYAPRK
jgi:2-iminobutanoate/2-iminopropanoate deaminase